MDAKTLAKEIRDQYAYQDEMHGGKGSLLLADMAVRFAKKFAEEDNTFDPIAFLDMCSPNPERFPIRDLWEEKC